MGVETKLGIGGNRASQEDAAFAVSNSSPDSLAQRVLDITVAGTLLVLLAPLFAVIATAVRLTSPGPVLYRQIRVGKGGRLFQLVKFRSMVHDSEKIGPWFTALGDPRITKLGKFLRSTSLDELPQLINVLRGEMSLVGPRPDVPAQLTDYTQEERRIILSVRPGITGLAQVVGRSNLSMHERTNYSVHYALHRSLLLDLKILLRTLWVVAGSRGTT